MKYLRNIGWGIVHVHTHDYRDIWLNPGHRIPLNTENREQLAYYKPYLKLGCVIEGEKEKTPQVVLKNSEAHLTVADDVKHEIKESTTMRNLKDQVQAYNEEEVTPELDSSDVYGHYGEEVSRSQLQSKSKVEIMKELKQRGAEFKTSQTKKELIEILLSVLGGE